MAALGQVVEVDAQEPVTLHKSTAAQEHRLLGKLHSLEGKINKATGMVRGGAGARVPGGQRPEPGPRPDRGEHACCFRGELRLRSHACVCCCGCRYN